MSDEIQPTRPMIQIIGRARDGFAEEYRSFVPSDRAKQLAYVEELLNKARAIPHIEIRYYPIER